MTTTLATATTDDLLAFLRSDSPPPKRVRANNRAAINGKSPGVYQREHHVRANNPPTPIEAATMRRPPMAGDKYKAATRASARSCGDYSEQRRHDEHTTILRRVECRLVAWLVCRSLGDAWRFEVGGDDYRQSYQLVHRATCATLSFRRAWNNEARYEIVPENVHRTDSMPRSISVSAERTPADIARDISRRLIGAGLFDQNAAHLSAGHERRAAGVKRRREILAVARAYGGGFAPSHWSHHNGQQRADTCHFGPAADEYGHNRETSINVESDYHGLKIDVSTSSVQLAIKIAELVRQYYN